MKWSEYNHQLDTIHAPESLVQRLHAMEEDADPLDAPRLEKPKFKLSALHFPKVKTRQVAAALVCCAGITALAYIAGPSPFRTATESTGEYSNASPQEISQENGTAGYGATAADTATVPETAMMNSEGDMSQSPMLGRSVSQRKVIYTADLTLESTEYDQTRAALDQALTETEGYVQQTNEYTRSNDSRNLEITYRIPVEQYPHFLELAAQAGNLIRTSETSDDVSSQYIDIQARVDALTTQRNRLLELEQKAENLSDLLTIEDQLTQTQYELESWQEKLNFLSNQTDYCTVHLDLSEVKSYTPNQNTPLSRLANTFRQAVISFGETLLNFVLWVVSLWPWLMFVGIVWVLVHWYRKKHTKN